MLLASFDGQLLHIEVSWSIGWHMWHVALFKYWSHFMGPYSTRTSLPFSSFVLRFVDIHEHRQWTVQNSRDLSNISHLLLWIRCNWFTEIVACFEFVHDQSLSLMVLIWFIRRKATQSKLIRYNISFANSLDQITFNRSRHTFIYQLYLEF